MNSTSVYDQTVDSSRFAAQSMQLAAQNITKSLNADCSAPRLVELLRAPAAGAHQQVCSAAASGLSDNDYPILASHGQPCMPQIKQVNSVPLPAEIVNHFTHIQCHCMMGLFPEIDRAWLTVDSDIYVWTYEANSDLAYYDGINETILAVGLVKPRAGVFHSFIKHLLVLATAVDIVVLGVTFSDENAEREEEIQLIPDPVFTLPTDGATVSTVVGTEDGRLFFGTKEGSLFEISYQAESGWFGKRCKKVNLSTSTLSFLVPSFLNAALSEEDGIAHIAIDNSRHILYCLTEKGAIEVCDLGETGNSFSRITKVNQNAIVNQVMGTINHLESQNFKPIVSISAIEAADSANINLVAVSQTGVRFYFSVTGLNNDQPNQRPYTLTLVHVRLPPGYSANIASRPRAVHMADYRDRDCLLVSTIKENEDRDVLWCLSSDLFPLTTRLAEAYSTVNLDGTVLAMAEVRHRNTLLDPFVEAPPLVVRQHFEAPKKYVVLTSHGVQIFLKLRPVDLLRQILKDGRGHVSPALKTYYQILNEDQACATSLILASLECEENVDIAEQATLAFFAFGGEPKVQQQHQLNQTTMLGQSMFAPNVISTPAAPHFHQRSPAYLNTTMSPPPPNFDAAPFQFSPKHNGLYLYLGRILRPVWHRCCVSRCTDGKNTLVVSTISASDCQRILNNLTALHNFIKHNTQLSASCAQNATSATLDQHQLSSMHHRSNATIKDAQIEERQSLEALRLFVGQCCQILGFWRILCEHQFHELVAALPVDHQQVLQSTTFKDLFTQRLEVCSLLIGGLVNSYLGDNASVDSISGKLREVCPQLYKSEDAAFSKATEILKTIRNVQNVDEKEEMLLAALQLCKSVGATINLGEICKQFTVLKAYKVVVELCHFYGQKIDPEKISEHYYNSEDHINDQEGYSFFSRRMDVYGQVRAMLDAVYAEQALAKGTSQEAPVDNITRQVIALVLDCSDEIMHVALYGWMVSKGLNGELIRIGQPSLETYLKKTAAQNPNQVPVKDLLWKFYESSGEHASAAKILDELASMQGAAVQLTDRLAYLARAIMCMRSHRVGYVPAMGVFLRDLEDKMEVAKVQEQILHTIANQLENIPNGKEAMEALNSGLYDISQLYENFAEPMKLLECQLAIMECAGHTDNLLIESIWRQMLSNELRLSCGSGGDRMAQLLTKVKLLVRRYAASANCFPIENIIYELELVNARLGGDKAMVPQMFVDQNVPFDKLITVYGKLITLSANDKEWQREEHEFHLAEATAALIAAFLRDQDNFGSVERRKIATLCVDAVMALFSLLYSKANAEHVISQLRGIKTQLARI